ncbi:MAG: PAS domain S-box protein [Pontiellaceae bacterium]|nr:PAS domain S-box protein [Pontiellaceae bacterium]
MKTNRRISSLGIAGIALLTIGALVGVIFLSLMPQVRDYVYGQRRELVRNMMQLAMSEIGSRHTEVLNGTLSLEEAKARTIQRMRDARYGRDMKEYFWILDKKPSIVMHPYRPDLEGETLHDIDEFDVRSVLQKMVQVADSPEGEGFVDYLWQWQDDRTQVKPKISYVGHFEPWGWVVGTGVYVDDIEDYLSAFRRNLIKVLAIILLTAGCGIGLLTLIAIKSTRKIAEGEEEVTRTEARFRTLFDVLPFSCFINDADGHILEANQYHYNATGCSREELRNKTMEMFGRTIASEDRDELIGEMKATGYISAKEVHLRTPGKNRWILLSSSAIDWYGEKAYISATVDITMRKLAALENEETIERMRAQSAALAAIAESDAIASGKASLALPVLAEQTAKALRVERVGTWIRNEATNEIRNMDQYVAGTHTHTSGNTLCLDDYPSYQKAMRQQTRVDAHDVLTDPRVKELVDGWFIPNHITSLLDAAIIQEGRFIGLFSCAHIGPKRVWHPDEQAFASSMAALAGQILATEERRLAEKSLRESEENLRATLDSIGDGVVVTDLEGRVARMNPVGERLSGWTQDDARGRPLAEVLKIHRADEKDRVINPIGHALQRGVIEETFDNLMLESKNGGTFQIEESVSLIHSASGDTIGAVLVFKDVTEKRALQEQLNHAQKMESIGQLASGIAHDFNNVLGGIMGAAELLRTDLAGGEDPEEDIRIILNNTERAAGLTSKLLSFARKQPTVSSMIDAMRPLRDAVELFESTVDKRIRISLDLPDEEIPVMGDPSQLQNAFMNILINASHAMPEGGGIYVSAEYRDLDSGYCKATAMEIVPGPFIEIEIRDTGCGIPKENMKRIFEPFYTTKESGKGTGLGLASVLGTIRQHGGVVNVYSEPGTGTSFHILLPVAEKGEKKAVESPKQIIRGSGTILLVDDENNVRSTAQAMLENLGYRVLIAENGRQGLDLFRQKSNTIDLVILDMIMPEMNGKDCFLAMKEIQSDVRVILSSGFSRDDEVAAMKSAGLRGFIQKPFRLAQLAQTVQDALQE